jgi:heat shock protein HslJ
MKRFATAILMSALMVSACQSDNTTSETPIPTDITGLDNTNWTLVEIQSPDDRTGTVRPDDPQKYTMNLGADGKASMKLNCNRGMGTWQAGSAGGNSGSFEFGPISTTKALCPPPSLDQQIARDAQYIRSYVLDGRRLYLNLMADGGNYVWEKSAN